MAFGTSLAFYSFDCDWKPDYSQEVMDMQKDHFEILLEDMRHNFQLAFEKIESLEEKVDKRLDEFALTLGDVKSDVRDVKRSVGLFHSIANDHEARIQSLEESIRHRQ